MRLVAAELDFCLEESSDDAHLLAASDLLGFGIEVCALGAPLMVTHNRKSCLWRRQFRLCAQQIVQTVDGGKGQEEVVSILAGEAEAAGSVTLADEAFGFGGALRVEPGGKLGSFACDSLVAIGLVRTLLVALPA